MILPKRPLSILITGLAFCACTGATLGENEPGDDTYLEGNRRAGVEAETSGGVFCRYNGSIAVDHRSEMAFVLASAREGECDPKQAAGGVEQKAEDAVEPAITKTLFAATPDGGRALRIADLSAYTDLRLLFPAEGVLLMAERDGGDELRLLHESSYAEVARKHAWVRYHGTRMSPSRRFLAVADNTSDEHPIHVIDTRSLRGVAVPHDGDTLEAVWANGSDRLVAVVFYET